MDEMLPVLRAVIGGRKVVTYGHSQGGYGALKFSAALGASEALAFCPQWSINPEDVASHDPRYLSHHHPELGNGLAISADELSGSCYAIYDPHDFRDNWHIERLRRLPRIQPVICPFGGHETVRLIAEARQSRDLIAMFKLPQSDRAHRLRGLLRNSRRESPTYRRIAMTALMKRGRFDCWRKHTGARDGNGALFLAALRSNMQLDHGAVSHLLQTASAEVLTDAGLGQYWAIAREAEASIAELRIALLIREKHFSDPAMRLLLVETFISLQEPGRARFELSDIVARHGVDKENATILRLAQLLEMSDERAPEIR
jgi:hypothetical protein